MNSSRKTQQFELPIRKENSSHGYDIYPVHNIGDGEIRLGYHELAKELSQFEVVKLDGYVGTLFNDVRSRLSEIFEHLGATVNWVNVEAALLPENKISELVEPFLGGNDAVFGRITSLIITDFFDLNRLQTIAPTHAGITIYYGTGASLIPVEGKLVFFDVAKNEIQFRSRAGVVRNLGASASDDPKKMYKRFYFVDWVVLNKYVKSICEEVDYFVDGQRIEEITWMRGDEWRDAVRRVTTQPLRARPWFEPGAWGGSWIKDHIEGLATDVVNYAWSFELIYPENGVILESSGLMLETTFDSLLFLSGESILGVDHPRYGDIFPIRFDFLDTINGGNLSVQCHPTVNYMRANFGEVITQEETYYILDCQPDSKVYLGFQEGVKPKEFRAALEESQQKGVPMEIEKYVQSFTSKKHDLFLIPPGTVHASGKGTLVLEISSTPYIYTFKMYDWLRLDLDGKPRPLNIDRGMSNLNFSRSGKSVPNELISKVRVVEEAGEFTWFHLPTHGEHLYDVHRYEITGEVEIESKGKANILSLVDGEVLTVIAAGKEFVFRYAETFVIPAAIDCYKIKNTTAKSITVVKAFIK